jgi:hypothetical protein
MNNVELYSITKTRLCHTCHAVSEADINLVSANAIKGAAAKVRSI